MHSWYNLSSMYSLEAAIYGTGTDCLSRCQNDVWPLLHKLNLLLVFMDFKTPSLTTFTVLLLTGSPISVPWWVPDTCWCPIVAQPITSRHWRRLTNQGREWQVAGGWPPGPGRGTTPRWGEKCGDSLYLWFVRVSRLMQGRKTSATGMLRGRTTSGRGQRRGPGRTDTAGCTR